MKIKDNQPHWIVGRHGEKIKVTVSCSGTDYLVSYSLEGQNYELTPGEPFVLAIGRQKTELKFQCNFTKPSGGTYRITLEGDPGTETSEVTLHQSTQGWKELVYNLALGGDETKGDYG